MGAIRRIYRRLRYGNRSESEIYLDGLRAMGVEIGRGTVAFAPTMTFLDVSRPWMLTIGENVQITKGVTVYVRKVAPLGDPVEVTVRGYELSLRKADADLIEVK